MAKEWILNSAMNRFQLTITGLHHDDQWGLAKTLSSLCRPLLLS